MKLPYNSLTFISMRLFILLTLFSFLGSKAQSQADFDEHIETLPIFGLTLMPGQESFLTLEADYDGMFFSERELTDFFMLNRFEFNQETVNWTFYDYWNNNNRGGISDVPYDHMFYNLIVNAQGTKFAVNLQSEKEYNTEVMVYDIGSQAQIAVFDVFEYDENVEHINLLKFSTAGETLFIGTERNGTYQFDLNSKNLTKMEVAGNLQLVDYSYKNDALYFVPFTIDDFDEITYGEGFFIKDAAGTRKIDAYPPVRDFTKHYTPTEMNKIFTPYYRQDFDTYFTTKEGGQQTILYRNLKTFKTITTDQPIDIW